jgi:hypothetical protein
LALAASRLSFTRSIFDAIHRRLPGVLAQSR